MDPVCEWRVHGCTKVPEYVIAAPAGSSPLRIEACANCAEWFNPDWRERRDPLPAATPITLTSREAMVLRAIVGNRAQTVTPQLLAVAIPMPLANVRVLLAGLAARGLVVGPDGSVADAAVGLYLTDAGRRAVGA